MREANPNITFDEAVKVFRDCFPEPRWKAESFKQEGESVISVPAFPGVHNNWVRYRIRKTEEWHAEVYYAEFVIFKDADNRWDIVGKSCHLVDNDPERQRQISHWTYYANNHWQTRQPAWNAETLKADIALLQDTFSVLDDITKQDDTQECEKPPVGIGVIGVIDLLKRQLSIPDYQRAYCWTDKNIKGLLADLSDWHKNHAKDGKEYHIGSIILKRQECGTCEVIDGQQRLITLALIATSKQLALAVDIDLGSSNQTYDALNAIRHAKTIVDAWEAELDLAQVVVGVVEIGKGESEDLAFNFFNHLNSSGVPLTDYELLKGHHLRYVKEDSVAQVMALRWHALDTGPIADLKERLLHKCLYRIRKWLAHEPFFWNADELETHELFHEFILDFTPPQGVCTSYKEVSIDSMLSGGLEFFDYVNRYRMLFEQFVQHSSIEAISPLHNLSYGTLHDGMIALAFLFYCKFGDIYLKDAVYAISWYISSLRSMGQVRRSYLGNKTEFRAAAMAISRATHESEAIGKLLSMKDYVIPIESGWEAGNYWRELSNCAKELEGDRFSLLNDHYCNTYEHSNNKKKEGDEA